MNPEQTINKKTKKPKEIAIVGGGLAGTFLAAECCKRGHRVTLIDDEAPGAASIVAAGLFNIITGKLPALTWLAEPLMEAMHSFYKEAPFESLKAHVNFMPIYRPFKSVYEQNEWAARAEGKPIELVFEPQKPDYVVNPLGGCKVIPCGWVDSSALITAIKTLCLDQFGMQWLRTNLEYQAIDAAFTRINLGGKVHSFDEIVFCEGARILENPFWQRENGTPSVDIRPLKGQLIQIKLEGEEMPFVLSNNIYMIPHGQGHFTVGATNERDFEHPYPDPTGIASLMEDLKKAVSAPFELLDINAGIRPTTRDRRPVLGTHPKFPHFHLFNGLGTKGILQAPYLAALFTQYLEGEFDILNKEIALKRLLF